MSKGTANTKFENVGLEEADVSLEKEARWRRTIFG
jgi:hypothetical protein